MKFLKKYESFSDDTIQTLKDICLELEDIGFTVRINDSPCDDGLYDSYVSLYITDFSKGYLSPFTSKDVIETIERIQNFLPDKEIKIYTHRRNHSSQFEELKVYGGGLMDLEDNYLDYRMYWVSLKIEK